MIEVCKIHIHTHEIWINFAETKLYIQQSWIQLNGLSNFVLRICKSIILILNT